MPLDLSKWKLNTEAANKEETTNATKDSTNPSATTQSTIHNASSQSVNVPTAASILQTIAPAKDSASAPANQGSKDSRSSQPTDDPKLIQYQEVSDRIASLRDAIHSDHPKMPGLLQEIWKTLHSYPEQVTLLEEDQMEIIISGLEKVVDTDLANIVLNTATKGKKSKTPVSMDSLGF